MSHGFKGGVILPAGKAAQDLAIEIMPQPAVVYIPLSQYGDERVRVLVQPGDAVRAGDPIAEPETARAVAVHASIRGRVREISMHPHPCSGRSLCCVIDAAEGAEPEVIREKLRFDRMEPQELRKTIRAMGIVGMGGAGFPAGWKLAPPADRPVDTLIVNGCESEPMVSCDRRLMLEYPMGVIEGARIFQKACEARRLIVALPERETEIAGAFKKEGVEVHRLAWKFPLGSEKQLIRAVLNRTVPRRGLPWDIGCIVHNAATCYAGFQAVCFRKPLFERVITVAGNGVRDQRNLLVRIGTAARDLVEFCGGYTGAPAMIIFGGPMTGSAVPTDLTPVAKETTAVLVLNERSSEPEGPCVRCARCVDVCPMGLMPCEIRRRISVPDLAGAEELGLTDCLECGCCAYVCPARIPLVHYFRYGKAELKGRIPS